LRKNASPCSSSGPVAQLVEHRTFNAVVAGSSPARLTTPSYVFVASASQILTSKSGADAPVRAGPPGPAVQYVGVRPINANVSIIGESWRGHSCLRRRESSRRYSSIVQKSGISLTFKTSIETNLDAAA
jgi:hypothetical protein